MSFSTVWFEADWSFAKENIERYIKNNPVKPSFVRWASTSTKYIMHKLTGEIKVSGEPQGAWDDERSYDLDVRPDGSFEEYIEQARDDGFIWYVNRKVAPDGTVKERSWQGCPIGCSCDGKRYIGDCRKDGFKYAKKNT